MSRPIVKQVGTRYDFFWEKERVYAIVSRLHDHSDGRVTAEVSLKTSKNDARTHILHGQLNLLSTRSKKDLIKELADRYPLPEPQWVEMVEQLCSLTLEGHCKGKPPKEIWPVPEGEPAPEPEMLITPLLYRNKPTLIFGEGSSGKSCIALALAIIAQLPYNDNPLWLQPKQANALYLDYESDEDEFRQRLTRICRGFGVGPVPILYRECDIPLVEDIEHLEQIVSEYNIGLVIIDSLGVASGGASLNDAATATTFYAALRRLGVTSLLITHISKDAVTRKPSAFGSVYFTNLARSVFAINKHQEQESTEIAIDLVHTKNNQGPLLTHQGFKIRFLPEKTLISRIEPESVPEFLEKMSLKARIGELLKDEGKLPAKDIAEMIDKPENTVRSILSRNKGLFVRMGNEWGLMSNDYS